MYFSHFSQIPDYLWHWPSFSKKELASRGGGSFLLVESALDKLQSARNLMNNEFIIHSAYRDPLHNARIGGAPLSRHKYGDAFDIGIKNHNKEELYNICLQVGFSGFGFYPSFLHVDCGPKRHWGSW